MTLIPNLYIQTTTSFYTTTFVSSFSFFYQTFYRLSFLFYCQISSVASIQTQVPKRPLTFIPLTYRSLFHLLFCIFQLCFHFFFVQTLFFLHCTHSIGVATQKLLERLNPCILACLSHFSVCFLLVLTLSFLIYHIIPLTFAFVVPDCVVPSSNHVRPARSPIQTRPFMRSSFGYCLMLQLSFQICWSSF